MGFKSKLRSVVEDNTTKKGRIFDYIIDVLIILSIIAFSLETFPDNSERTTDILHKFDIVCFFVFSIEYLLRIYVAKKKSKYIFSFYGIIDFLAIAPFFLSSFLDLRFLRAFRILKIFRSLQSTKFNLAIKRINIASKLIKEELMLFFIVIFILIFTVSSGIYYFEHEAQPETFKSVFHSMWWAVVTLMTVGYGDVVPVTLGGRIFTIIVLILGVLIVTVPAGLSATSLMKAREIQEEQERNKKTK
ncbi:MAG: ion transporter [Flavobacteriaceae bacterium]|tara:strand:+ start:351 stop:1088 length:738 start_codon:yes stop_codon:yes gene_type:complete